MNFAGPGSLPGYARRRGGEYDDGASDISSTSGFGSAYGYRSGSSKKYNRRALFPVRQINVRHFFFF